MTAVLSLGLVSRLRSPVYAPEGAAGVTFIVTFTVKNVAKFASQNTGGWMVTTGDRRVSIPVLARRRCTGVCGAAAHG